MPRLVLLLSLLSLPPGLTWADAPKIEDVRATRTGATWRLEVTLSHPDTGWDHYADGWRVLAPDGTELGLRTLSHPHVEEQPFTRSLSGITVPPGLSHVLIQPRCLTDGWSAPPIPVPLK